MTAGAAEEGVSVGKRIFISFLALAGFLTTTGVSLGKNTLTMGLEDPAAFAGAEESFLGEGFTFSGSSVALIPSSFATAATSSFFLSFLRGFGPFFLGGGGRPNLAASSAKRRSLFRRFLSFFAF